MQFQSVSIRPIANALFKKTDVISLTTGCNEVASDEKPSNGKNYKEKYCFT